MERRFPVESGRRLREVYPNQAPEMHKRSIINAILHYLESNQSDSPEGIQNN